jgi:GWxTD domain-containing protein
MAVSRIHASGLLARITFLAVSLSVLCTFVGIAAIDKPRLSQRYRAWLDKDVVYIISRDEKDAFLKLPDDSARDKFIERFWEVRNPTPGAPENAYKSEHYRRLEYASQYFGYVSHTEGWRTDMGRVYITLGEPAQRQKLLGLQKVTPMEIWFYSNSNPALPPFFYVVFYQRDPTDEFRLYSPYADGPEKLITAVAGPTRQNALSIISQDAGRDVARVTLSLLPDEPVDFQSGRVSLQSDVMLATVRNLANNPISQAELANRRRLLEDVSHSVILGDEYLDIATTVLRDPSGTPGLHYVLRLKKPEDFTIGQSEKSGYYYAALASVRVFTADGKPIFNEEKKISRALTEDQFQQMKSKVFGYEGLLPLPPNKYKLQFQLINILGHTTFRREVEVVIPDPALGKMQLSDLVPFADASMLPAGSRSISPFSGGGVKFIPMAGKELQLPQGRPLKFFYQLWVPSELRSPGTSKKLEASYVYGRLAAQDSATVHDDIQLDQVDAGGSIISGKQIPTSELLPGNYRLVVTVRDPDSGMKAYGSLNFSVFNSTSASPAWDVSDDQLTENIATGVNDFQRGTCYLASGDRTQATAWLQSAYTKNPSNEQFRGKLIEVYFDQQKYTRVVELYGRSGLTDSMDEQTIVRIAESLSKTGEVAKAVGLMESATKLKPSSGSLQLGLAEFYRRAGELQKAAAAEQKGKSLNSTVPPS